jgi:SAM-dependent methyltransferase
MEAGENSGRIDHHVALVPIPVCPACAGSGPTRFDRVPEPHEGPPGRWRYRQCTACGSLWLDPRPRDEDLIEAYDASASAEADETPPPDPPRTWRSGIRDALVSRVYGYPANEVSRPAAAAAAVLHRARVAVDRVGEPFMWIPASWGSRVLDIGCGDGRFLAAMRARGWTVAGIEPDPAAVRAARGRGIDVHVGVLDDVELPDASFDVVTMSHVIEHVPDPVRALSSSLRLLRPGGRLVAVTPNASSIGLRSFGKAWAGLDPPRHLVLFTPRALARCAGAAGFASARVRSTARQASFIWHASWWLRTRGALPPEFATSPVSPAKRRPALFALADTLAAARRRGEELVLVAER